MNAEVMALLQSVAPFLAGISAAILAYMIVSRISVEATSGKRSMVRRLERFAGVEEEPPWVERLGEGLILSLRLNPRRWEMELNWAKLGGHFREWSVGGLVSRGLFLSFGGVLYSLMIGAPLLWLSVPILFAFPFIRVRSKAKGVRNQVRRELPELSTLIAAEMSAGNSAEQALVRAGELPGPLGTLIARAVAKSRSANRPLFSRGGEVKGILLESLSEMQMPELMAFVSQLDLVASKGAAGPELMDNIARGLAREYRMRVLMDAEKLESNLVIPATIFFFLPFVAAVMVPLLIPLFDAF